MIGRETNEPTPFSCLWPVSSLWGRAAAQKHRHVTDGLKTGRNVDGSSVEEILNILFIERQAKLTEAPGGGGSTRIISMRPQTNVEWRAGEGIGGFIGGIQRRQAVHPMQAESSRRARTGAEARRPIHVYGNWSICRDRCWKLSGIRLETSSLRGSTHGYRDSRTSVTSRLGKEAYEG